MPEQNNPALSDEKLASLFDEGLSNQEIPESATFFWMQAAHLGETGRIYEFPDVQGLFEKVKEMRVDRGQA